MRFTAKDLARTVVCASPDPLWEIVLSWFRLRDRGMPELRPWVRALGERADDPALRAGCHLLGILAPCGERCPAFLTPAEGRHGLDAGLAAVRRTPRQVLRDQLARCSRLPGWVSELPDGTTAAMTRLVGALRGYHDVAIAPYADVIAQSVAADHAHRMHAFATGGLDGLFSSLCPLVRWRPPVLEVVSSADRDLHLRGRGLRLVPSYFCAPPPAVLADPPVLVYPVAQQLRGHPMPARHSLDALLGSSRSAVLRSVDDGTTATQLARRLDMSVSSVSRHAAVLRDAGLIASHRHDSAVVHTLTALGAAILGG